jgi:hypothetical protein
MLDFFINNKESEQQLITLEPGESRQVSFNHVFNEPGNCELSFSGNCYTSVQVGGKVKSPFRTYSSASHGNFGQVNATDFFITSLGELGGDPVNMAHYAGVVEDDYSTVYLPGGMKEKSYVVVKILGRELTSNYTKTGIMIRNGIDQPGKSPGYLVMEINGYFGGGGLIEWDSDSDGYLDSVSRYNPGGWPKWMIIEKNGQTFNFYASPDQGNTWAKEFTTKVETAKPVQDVGLFHVSDYKDKTSTARFSDFIVREGLFNGKIQTEDLPEDKKREQPL